ncbi:uncharacterized protein [Drosophila suzukii]|uniref:Uncharacterized protein isoform X2 n=1 Tax=Drosophila suzukii TaxID=28584 RepID=A0ABM4TY94_DROSZ|nr:uncharacterized protein LOC118879670 isoform X2 [Drosophila suzukii]
MDILPVAPSQRKTTSNTISDDLFIRTPDTKTTSYLAAKAQLEDPLASIGKRKIGRPLRNSWRSHSQPLPVCWAASCRISGSTPFSHFLKVQYAYWDSELYCGGAGKMAKHPWDEKEALIY